MYGLLGEIGKENLVKHLRILTFALALGMVVSSPAQYGIPIPEVGTPAYAYAPCVIQLQAVIEAQYWVDYWFAEMQVPPWDFTTYLYYNSALADLSAALADYNHCVG